MAQPVHPVQMTNAEREAYSRGRKHFERGEIDPALEAFATLLKTRENFADIHYMVGVLLESKGDFAGAVSSLREALRINPSYCEAALALASVCERQGDFAGGRSVAERFQALRRPGDGTLDPTTRGKLEGSPSARRGSGTESRIPAGPR